MIKNIVFFGGSGMIGRNFKENYNSKKYNILYPSRSQVDLLDYFSVEEYLNVKSPDLVIHSAAKVGGIHSNIKNPISYFSDNLEMGLNVVKASFKAKVKKLINVGSSCMYPKDISRPILESDLFSGRFEDTNEAYAISKVTVAKYCEYISQKSKLNYKTVIPCNMYGKYDKFGDENSHLVAAVIKKIYYAKINNMYEVEIWGDGKARREFMYASDFTDFLFFSIQNFHKLPQYLNVGIGKDYTVFEYYKMISELLEHKCEFKFNLKAPVGMKRKLVNNDLIKSLGWKNNTDLKTGLSKTIKYFYDYEL